jgi:hypothetical protein
LIERSRATLGRGKSRQDDARLAGRLETPPEAAILAPCCLQYPSSTLKGLSAITYVVVVDSMILPVRADAILLRNPPAMTDNILIK